MEVPRVAYDKLANATRGEPSETIRARIDAAWERQQRRLAGTGLVCNADIGPAQIREFCALRESAQALMRAAIRQMHLSVRAYHRILKVSRTIADLEGTGGFRRTIWRRRCSIGRGCWICERNAGKGRAYAYTLDYAAGNRILTETTPTETVSYLYGHDCLGEQRGEEWLYYLHDAEGYVR